MDKTGASFTFEKGVKQDGGRQGFADVWKRDYFGWEYKRKHKDFDAAYNQLLRYYEHLEQPPLLIVSDAERFEIHTKFNNAVPKTYSFTLDQLDQPSVMGLLEAAFYDPQRLHPKERPDKLTEEAAERFAKLADSLRKRYAPRPVAHFLTQVVFTLFAEDIGLLPRGTSGERIFSEAVRHNQGERYTKFPAYVRALFSAMAAGGDLQYQEIAHFNGGLFEAGSAVWVPDLTIEELAVLLGAAELDWSAVEPSIFGTLFERGLDEAKRSQLGAHYTSREDIRAIVEPVLMSPLRREWAAIIGAGADRGARGQGYEIQSISAQPLRNDMHIGAGAVGQGYEIQSISAQPLQEVRDGFLEKLARVTVLDPACGSGNFLYVSLNLLKDLEKEVINHEAFADLPPALPKVSPAQLYGIEISEYAHELASVVVWIGFIQWHKNNGYPYLRRPILQKLDNIENKDAILGVGDDGALYKPEWPSVDVIVGNPPFLGDKLMRRELGDKYVDSLRSVYAKEIPGQSDLVCYWFEQARHKLGQRLVERVGLLATQGIRGGANRSVLERIAATGNIFFAYSDREWIQDGANVHVSMIGFDSGDEHNYVLDGNSVAKINSNLTAATDLTFAVVLKENAEISFIGVSPHGSFDLDAKTANLMFDAPTNINGRSNRDVVKPVVNAADITGRHRNYFTIDFGPYMSINEASMYELPFEYVKRHVKPVRDRNRRPAYRDKWWIFAEARSGMREALAPVERYVATPRVSKHRLFVWLNAETVANDALVVFARQDDYFLGVLHSYAHEVWALRQSTQLREKESGNRYTPSTAFETFPFPYTPNQEPTDDPKYKAIAEAAKELNALRDKWLNPEKTPNMEEGRYQKLLKERTLTKLYNERPTWLQLAHEKLDKAVFAAYGWEYPLEDEEILRRLLALNLERAGD